jgi:hypothetical protein
MEKKEEVEENNFLEKMIANLKDLKNKEFEIKDTSFTIEKLPPYEGFELFEEIRINLVKTADGFDSGNGSEDQNIILFTKTIMGLPPSFIKSLMSKMFKYIQFQGEKIGVEKGWINLKGMEDTAFQNFEVINIYEVLARALFINFSGSFSEITSAFPGAGQILNRLQPKT